MRLEELLRSMQPEQLAARIDHAVLKPSAARDELEKAVEELERLRLRCLIVTPTLLPAAREMTRRCVGAVAGFPFGYGTLEAKVKEVEDVIAMGADEVDYVANTQAFLMGRRSHYVNELKAVREICRAARVKCKIIIETPLLSSAQTIRVVAETVAREVEPDFIKTSSGFADRATYPEDVAAIDSALRRAGLRDRVAVKAAGGIRTGLQAALLISMGADVIGSSRPGGIIASYREARRMLLGL